jgi:hypothetical protein
MRPVLSRCDDVWLDSLYRMGDDAALRSALECAGLETDPPPGRGAGDLKDGWRDRLNELPF